ncbi:uncharacterized protein LOC134815723 [Bolinopsis microptera]|uniref:uncharacterized protein LOC134815723 n=1 Tax=Bolinopsis microptera TaxID=2820187 RepID=UPI00307916EA
MKIKLLVVRHGETDFNTEHRINGQFNSNLTGAGIRESEICGRYLQALHFDKVLVSDLGRTIKTLQCFGLAGEMEGRLRDRNFGPYNGELYAIYVKAKHEERQRLCNGTQDIDGQYLVPSSSSSCVLSCSDHGHANGPTKGHAKGNANGHANGPTNGNANGHANGLDNGHANGPTKGHANGPTKGHANGPTKGHAKGNANALTNGKATGNILSSRDNVYYDDMKTEIEPRGVERYENMFLRIEDLILDTMYKTNKELSKKKQTANVLFVTHCSPVRMCAMVLSSFSAHPFPKGLRKFNIPNNSISEFNITVNDETHNIENVELGKFASTKHLHM